MHSIINKLEYKAVLLKILHSRIFHPHTSNLKYFVGTIAHNKKHKWKLKHCIVTTVFVGRRCHEDIIQCRFGSILKWWSHYLVSLLAHEMPLQRYNKDAKQTSSGSTNYNSFWIAFAGIALKLEKMYATFSIFYPCLSTSVATEDRKQFQCQNIVENNKTGPLFWEYNWWEKSSSFLKRGR